MFFFFRIFLRFSKISPKIHFIRMKNIALGMDLTLPPPVRNTVLRSGPYFPSRYGHAFLELPKFAERTDHTQTSVVYVRVHRVSPRRGARAIFPSRTSTIVKRS